MVVKRISCDEYGEPLEDPVFADADVPKSDMNCMPEHIRPLMEHAIACYGNEDATILTEYGYMNTANYIRYYLIDVSYHINELIPLGALSCQDSDGKQRTPNFVAGVGVNKSGGFMTSILNELNTESIHRWIQCPPGEQEKIPLGLKHNSDDNIFAIPRRCKELWLSRCSRFAELTGIQLTSGAKDGTVVFNDRIEDMAYLGRRIRRIKVQSTGVEYTIGVLPKEVILSIVSFCKRKAFCDNYPSQIVAALVESAFYPKEEVYDIVARASQVEGEILPPYQLCQQWFISYGLAESDRADEDLDFAGKYMRYISASLVSKGFGDLAPT
jgi:hypothetical protein